MCVLQIRDVHGWTVALHATGSVHALAHTRAHARASVESRKIGPRSGDIAAMHLEAVARMKPRAAAGAGTLWRTCCMLRVACCMLSAVLRRVPGR
eukprot:364126-Chlamydomonas_euryale.AAC.9